MKKIINTKIKEWTDEVQKLSKIARTEPQTAYAGLIHVGKWMYTMRTNANIAELFTPIEDALRYTFLPAMTGRKAISDAERELLALPCRLGGLGITIPNRVATAQYQSSTEITAPIVHQIIQQKYVYNGQVQFEHKKIKSEAKNRKRLVRIEEANNIQLPKHLERAKELGSEKGASNWLTTLPIEAHGFALHNSAFRDAINLRYGWMPHHLPSQCDCKEAFTIHHVMSCPKGAFPTMRHNEIRDLTANLLTEVRSDVCTEPELTPLEGEQMRLASTNVQDGARVDIRAKGFWGCPQQRTFFEVQWNLYNADTWGPARSVLIIKVS